MFSQLSLALSHHNPQFASVPIKMKIKEPSASRSVFRTKSNIYPLSTVQTLQGVTAHSSRTWRLCRFLNQLTSPTSLNNSMLQLLQLKMLLNMFGL